MEILNQQDEEKNKLAYEEAAGHLNEKYDERTLFDHSLVMVCSLYIPPELWTRLCRIAMPMSAVQRLAGAIAPEANHAQP